jgi:chromosomal replication initiation ATPase DnaA
MIQVETAIKVACDAVGIPVAQFADKSRIEENVDARSLAYKLLKEFNTEWSLERIGRILGKDHTTVRHCVIRVDKSIDTGGTLGELYAQCKEKLI